MHNLFFLNNIMYLLQGNKMCSFAHACQDATDKIEDKSSVPLVLQLSLLDLRGFAISRVIVTLTNLTDSHRIHAIWS